MIKEKWVWGITKVVVEESEILLVEKMKKARKKNKEIIKIIEKMKKSRSKDIKGDKWKIEYMLVLKEEKVYVLKNKKLRLEVI